MDILFAAATMALLSGLNLPGTRIPIFTPLAGLIGLIHLRDLTLNPRNHWVFANLIFVFLAIHILFSLRVSPYMAQRIMLQAGTVLAFVLPFVCRYSSVSPARYFKWVGIGFVCMAAYIVYYHISIGKYTSWKSLGRTKVLFVMMPVVLLIFSKWNRTGLRSWTPWAFAAAAVLILLSGERKGYIVLALTAPLIFGLRSPITYLLPLALLALGPLAALLDSTGYVQQQIGTLTGFARGEVVSTISNDIRAWQADLAENLFWEHPVAGLGTGGYIEYIRGYLPGTVYATVGIHGELTRIAVENGVIGLIAYLTALAYGAWGVLQPVRRGRHRSWDERQIAGALFVSLVIYSWFEALDAVVFASTCLLPFVQYMRLGPESPGSHRERSIKPQPQRLRGMHEYGPLRPTRKSIQVLARRGSP